MRIDVKKMRDEQLEKISDGISLLKHKPNITIVQVEGDDASDVYVRNKKRVLEKAGINVDHIVLNRDVTPKTLAVAIRRRAIDSEIDGMMLQLPLPKHLKQYEQMLIDIIPEEKDIDRITTAAKGKLMSGDISILPCTVQACIDVMKNEIGEDLSGTEVAIFGRSQLVGMPLSIALIHMGATPTVFHTQNLLCGDANAELNSKYYNVVVSAVGIAEFIDIKEISQLHYPELLVDVGIVRRKAGGITGDITSTDLIHKSSEIKYTPVPSGIGLLTVVNVAGNLLKLIKRRELNAI
jgi:methylenetetrahydrofolate dehydrogenase (NADP+)/methenyltetrahydrofolate cyclohydrolase